MKEKVLEKKRYEQIMFTLNRNLLSASLFYYPSSLLDKVAAVNTAAAAIDSLRKYADNVFLMEADGSNYFLGSKPSYLKIAKKQELLDENLFEILELKESLSEDAFNLILRRYRERVAHFLVISQWFRENAKLDIPLLNMETFTSFKMQYGYIEAHLSELAEFSKGIDPPNQVAATNNDNFNAAAEELLLDEDLKVVLNNNIEVDSKKDKREFLKALKKDLEKVAERNLLKNVFHVDPNELAD